jgi:hypothetical protein
MDKFTAPFQTMALAPDANPWLEAVRFVGGT